MARKPREFTTESANYYLHPGLHVTPTEIDKETLGKIDALILEASFDSY